MIEALKSNKKSILIVIIIFIVLLSSFLIIVIFTRKEIILSLIGNQRIIIDYKETLIDTGVTACYGNKILGKCKDVSKEVKVKSNIVNGVIGKYEIVYEITKNNITKKITRYVDVVDKEKPTITLEEKKSNTFCPGEKFIEPGYTAYDEYDKELTEKVVVTKSKEQIIYSVEDSSGNITTEIRQTSYIDSIKPSIKLKGEIIYYSYIGSSYIEPGYTVNDNCDKNIKVNIIGNIDTSTKGDYVLTYTATDESGNTTSKTRTIKVIDRVINKSVLPSEKTIYLTFDDGPSPYTPKLLDILKKYNVKATFFVVCKSSSYDNYIVRAYNEGHAIGLHSCSHVWKNVYSSSEGFFNEINIISDKVFNLTGYRSTLIRFPGGSSNTVSKNYSKGIMTSLSKEVESKGYKYFDWTIVSGDTDTKSTAKIIKNVTSHIKDQPYYVVLQHDIKNYSVDAVEEIIKNGLSKGYTFAPLTMDSPEVHAKIAN